jgi:flagellar motor switch protein FliN
MDKPPVKLDADESLAVEPAGSPSSANRGKKGEAAVTLDSAIFSEVDVKLSVVLGHGTLAVRTLLNLKEGHEIKLDTPLDGSVDVTLNNHVVARGDIVAVGDQFGVRITQIMGKKT